MFDREEAGLLQEAADLPEAFEERAGILEYDAGLPTPEAELEAGWIVATVARNRGYTWMSLRAALASGTAKVAVAKSASGHLYALINPVVTHVWIERLDAIIAFPVRK